VPIVVGLTLGPQALGGVLMDRSSPGFFVAISMTTAAAPGTTPRSTSKTGTTAAKARTRIRPAVTGDTVGDPYKDTAGPAVNPLIKIINIRGAADRALDGLATLSAAGRSINEGDGKRTRSPRRQ